MDRRTASWRAWLVPLGLGVAATVAATMPARAAQTCHGTYTASSTTALPSPPAVQFNAGTDDSNQARIAQWFLGGMRDAGVTVDQQAPVQMNVAASVTPPGAGARAAAQPGTYYGFGWAADLSPGAAPIRAGTLTLSVSITDLASATIDWTGTLTCTIATDDKAQLARDIGALIGRTLGRSFVNRRI